MPLWHKYYTKSVRNTGLSGYSIIAFSIKAAWRMNGSFRASLLHHESQLKESTLFSCSVPYSPLLTVAGYLGWFLGYIIGGQVHYLSLLPQSPMTPVLVRRAEFSWYTHWILFFTRSIHSFQIWDLSSVEPPDEGEGIIRRASGNLASASCPQAINQ